MDSTSLTELHGLGVSFVVPVEERITICRLFDGTITLATYQHNTSHVFSLTVESAQHLAALLMKACAPTPETQPQDAA